MKVYLITSAKMEELYIRDWIDYYLSMGIDKIIINDNNKPDYEYPLVPIIKDYIDSGKVIVERYYDTHSLEKEISEKELKFVITYLYNKYKNECDWFLKMDIDEYLEIKETNNDIKKFLSQDKFIGKNIIVFPWLLYKVKPEYLKHYNTLPNSERFTPMTLETHNYYKHKTNFKYVVKSDEMIHACSTHLPSNTNGDENNVYDISKIVFANGDCVDLGYVGQKSDVSYTSTKTNLEYRNYLKSLYKIATIHHYRIKSDEEFFMQFEKMELYNHPAIGKQYEKNKRMYTNLCKTYPEWVDKKNRRDLYAIYFLKK